MSVKVRKIVSKTERQHKEECEAIRKLITLKPPRSETQKTISNLEKEIVALEAENAVGVRLLHLRKKMFHLLQHVVDELHTTIEDKQKSLMDELWTMMKEQKNGIEEASGGGSETMYVD